MNSDQFDPEIPPQKILPPKPDMSGGFISGTDGPADARTMAMLSHLLGGIFGVFGALIIWLIKKDEHPFVDQEGKEATNFQLTMFFGLLIGVALTAVSCGFLIFLPIIVFVVGIVFGVLGGIEAGKGLPYRYPMTVRLIK